MELGGWGQDECAHPCGLLWWVVDAHICVSSRHSRISHEKTVTCAWRDSGGIAIPADLSC